MSREQVPPAARSGSPPACLPLLLLALAGSPLFSPAAIAGSPPRGATVIKFGGTEHDRGGSGPSPGPGLPVAETIFRSGVIYTVDSSRTRAQAVAIGEGRILYVEDHGGLEPFIGPATRVIDLKGRMVLPGFHDVHVHPVTGGIDLTRCSLSGLASREAVFERIRQYAAENAGRPWIIGGGWELPVFPDANPTRGELDLLVPDRPAFLRAADGHSAWVNSMALRLAGVTAATPDPPRGRIERDPVTGEPSGTLRETAIELVSRHLAALTPEDYLEGARAGLAMAGRFGITSIQEAGADERILEAYAELERRGELTVRVVAAQRVSPGADTSQVGELARRRARYGSARLHATSAKIFADGVIESHTAALLEPYVDRPGDRGIANWEPETLNRMVAALDQAGFQVHVHAIGDRAVRMALDAVEAAQRSGGPRDAIEAATFQRGAVEATRRDLRHHIAHLELIDPADIPRFSRLGVTATFQALWAFEDPYIRELTGPVLGPERSRRLYPLGSVARSGAVIAGGSDWPVTSMNPLLAIQVALTRRDPEDTTGAGSSLDPAALAWLPEERVDLKAMLAAYTMGGAWVNHQEKETGSLEAGKAADLIVLDRNLFEIPAQEIGRARVLLTLLEGEEVFRDPDF